MLDVVVNGGWGVREEGPQQLAERWVNFLKALEDVDTAAFGGWREATDDDSTAPFISLSASTVVEYVTRMNPEPDVGRIGYTTSLWSGKPGMPEVVVHMSAGGTSPYVTDSCAVTMRSGELDESVLLVRRSANILGALAESWDIDWGQGYNDDEYDAVEEEFDLEIPDPRCGRVGYLSANRAALVPDGLPGTYTRTAHGGLIIDLTRDGEETPDIETVLETNRVLRAAGALERLPIPFDRAKW
ncbi:Imm52 family immunity protein [Streptomyces sp. KR80]|uniref:Imm52 family immunity protein n=1 Tax=Streptomyces sp. KR80 TaxID=3457426 RepID=UPI003FD613F3